jgi:hypothetical protein
LVTRVLGGCSGEVLAVDGIPEKLEAVREAQENGLVGLFPMANRPDDFDDQQFPNSLFFNHITDMISWALRGEGLADDFDRSPRAPCYYRAAEALYQTALATHVRKIEVAALPMPRGEASRRLDCAEPLRPSCSGGFRTPTYRLKPLPFDRQAAGILGNGLWSPDESCRRS